MSQVAAAVQRIIAPISEDLLAVDREVIDDLQSDIPLIDVYKRQFIDLMRQNFSLKTTIFISVRERTFRLSQRQNNL